MANKKISPILKLHEKITHPDRSQSIPFSIIKMEDFLCSNGKLNSKIINDIKSAGGLREYLESSNKIAFSPIIPDDILGNMNLESYKVLFDEYQPEYYLTPDAPTYLGCEKKSRSKINQILDFTSSLIKIYPEYTPIGLVKGSNLIQMDFHTDQLLNEFSITHFCLHVGDCLYKTPIFAKDLIVDCGRLLSEKVPHLMIYGVGSKHYFQRFHFADSFATNSHYIQALNHKKISGATWVNFKGAVTREIVNQNFNYLRRLVEHTEGIQELTSWLTDLSSSEQTLSTRETLSIDQKIVKILEH